MYLLSTESSFNTISAKKANKPQKWTHVKTITNEAPVPISCLDCSANKRDCAVNQFTIVHNCQACMAYLSPDDSSEYII